MTEHQAAGLIIGLHRTAHPGGRVGIVIALDPNPVHQTRQRREARDLFGVEPIAGAVVVKRVTQRHDAFGVKSCDQRRDAFQGGAGIVGRQELAAAGVRRAFLEMQIGQHKRLLVRPPHRAGRFQAQRFAVDENGANVASHGISLPRSIRRGKWANSE
jgi:hypothetical protein